MRGVEKMTLHNPGVTFCRTQNPVRVVRFLESVHEKIGSFQGLKGKQVDLWLTSEGEAAEFDPSVGSIMKVHRGSVVQEEKEFIRTRPPMLDKTFYPFSYYGIESTKGNFLLVCGKAVASTLLLRILKKNSYEVTMVNLGRSVQDKLCSRRDMFYYATSVDDEVEARTGKLRVTSRSTDTPLKGAKIDALIDKRGRNRDQGITWRETSVRPKIVFWINRLGRLHIKRMDLEESFFLELVDIITGVL